MDDFPQKLKKLVRTVLYGPAISQSDCRKASPYQLAYNKDDYEKDGGQERFDLYVVFTMILILCSTNFGVW